MGDKSDGLLRFQPQLEQLLVQVIAHDLVQGPKRFVHQQQVGVKGQRAGDGSALLHATGQLPGIFLFEPFQIDHLQGPGDMAGLLGALHAHDFQGQGHVLCHRAPGQQGGCLKHIAIVPVQAGLLRGLAVDGDLAASGLFQIGHHAQEGGFSAPGGTDEGNEIALIDREIHVRKGMYRPVIGLKGQGQFLRGNDG